jgi:NAD kinase
MKFKIISNPDKAWAKKLEADVRALVGEANVASTGADATVLIGGDGTVFHNKDEIQGAMFAIGGAKSKVCQCKAGDWKAGLAYFMKKKSVEMRTALSVKINGAACGWAINEAAVHSRHHNFLEIEVRCGKTVHKFGGDGAIISTATGSTGYAFSAGGFILSGMEGMIEAVAICPYMREFKAAIFPSAAEISVQHEGDADLVLDGQKIIPLKNGDVVSATGDREVAFAKVR